MGVIGLYSAHVYGLNFVDVKAEPLSFHSSVLLSYWFVLNAKAKETFQQRISECYRKTSALTDTCKRINHTVSALQEGTISAFFEFKAAFGRGTSPGRNKNVASQKQHPPFYFHR